MRIDRVVLRGVIICLVASAGIAYELIKVSPPRWQLIAIYAAVIGLALFRTTSRPAQDQHQPSHSAQSTHEKTS